MSAPEPPSVSPLDGPTAAAELLVDAPASNIDLGSLEEWVTRLLRATVPDASSFLVRLTDEATIRDLNRRYRRRDEPTDVLSFPGDSTPEGYHLGDVVIAVRVAEQQAIEAGLKPAIELRHLIIHGMLHCMGFDHEVDDGEMRVRERELRCEWIPGDA